MTEAALHRAVASYLRVALKPPTIWTTIGHGGGGRVRGAQLKAMGVQPGWPDILIIGKRGSESLTIGIELKRNKGRQSTAQKLVQQQFADAGAWLSVCRSAADVEKVIDAWGIPLHARVS